MILVTSHIPKTQWNSFLFRSWPARRVHFCLSRDRRINWQSAVAGIQTPGVVGVFCWFSLLWAGSQQGIQHQVKPEKLTLKINFFLISRLVSGSNLSFSGLNSTIPFHWCHDVCSWKPLIFSNTRAWLAMWAKANPHEWLINEVAHSQPQDSSGNQKLAI